MGRTAGAALATLCLAALGCGPGEPTPPRVLARVLPEARDAAPPELGPAARGAWSLAEPDGAQPLAVKVDPVRRPARVVRVPARLEARVPEGAEAVRFWVAPPVAAGDQPFAAPCTVRLDGRGPGDGEPWQQLVRSEPGSAGEWLELERAVAGPAPLVLELETESCPGPAAVAISELVPRARAPRGPLPNLVFVVIDTLRVDFMDCGETTRTLTPVLARWCERGVFFEDAHSSSPWTYPALASMLTGLEPWHHGAGAAEGTRSLPSGIPSAAQALRERGYATGAVVSNWHATRGLWRGFDTFVELLPGASPELAARRRAGSVVDSALAWLASEPSRPFFLWLVLIDLHEPVDAFRVRGAPPAECAGVDPLPVHWQQLGTPDSPPTPAQNARMECRRALYRVALETIDAALADLDRALVTTGLDTDTWILVASDHGEEFWEHAEAQRAAGHTARGIWGIGHGHTLYGELLSVPLLLVPPTGQPGLPIRSDALVAVEDVFPTLLARAGLEVAKRRDLARALHPRWRGSRKQVASGAVLYGPERRAVTTDRLRAIWTEPDAVEVYVRTLDPLERQPLGPEASEVRQARRLLDALRRVAPPHAAGGEVREPTPADREALEALGYGR